MDIHQIKKYWTENDQKLYTYKLVQLDNSRLTKATTEFLINCGLPGSCAPWLTFNENDNLSIQTPNQVFNIDFEELNDYLMIGSNGCGDTVCIDLNNDNEIVYLNHDNFFESVYMNSSVQQLSECIIKYRDFHASLRPKIENNNVVKRKFSDDEFINLCAEFKIIDNKCLLDVNFWSAELDYLLWERDNK